MRGKRLGDILLQTNVIDDMQLRSALSYQKQWGHPLGRCFIEMRMCEEVTITKALSLQFGVPYVRLAHTVVPEDVAGVLTGKVAAQTSAVPLAISISPTGRKTLHVAMTRPNNLIAIDTIRAFTNMTVEPVLASDEDISNAISRLYGGYWQEASVSMAAL